MLLAVGKKMCKHIHRLPLVGSRSETKAGDNTLLKIVDSHSAKVTLTNELFIFLPRFLYVHQIICTFGAKIMQTSAMKACFRIAECSLSYEKIMQTNANYLT